ncbi:MAG: ADOP family duplicated permease [Gemmatimonadota bacterium]|nr:ADOP family duplicated permease [Gemmatimonadota bacterium]
MPGGIRDIGWRAVRRWLDGLLQDIRLGRRRMIRAPGFTAVAFITITLGVAGNTALFALFEALLLRPPPYAEPEELVDIRLVAADDAFGSYSYPTLLDMEAATGSVFAGMTGAMPNIASFSDDSGRRDDLLHELVAGPYFQVLGIPAQVGRVFTPTEGTVAGADPVLVLSDAFWRRSFDADAGVVGRTVHLNGFPYTIVGVAPRGFHGVLPVLRPDFWALASMADQLSLNGPGSLEQRGQESFIVKARLAAGVTRTEAEAALGAFAEGLIASHSDRYADRTIVMTPTLSSPIHPGIDGVVVPVAGLVIGVMVLVLLIACVNLAGFLLARSEGRRREIAVRLALGARRGRLVCSLLTESVMLAVAGGTAGVVISLFLVDFLLNIKLPLPVDIVVDTRLNVTVLAFALGVTLSAALVLGLAPALRSTRTDASGALKDENAGGSHRAARVRAALAICQIAGAVVLLAAAVLFTRSLATAQRVDPGFGMHPAAIVWLEPGRGRSPAERRAFYDAYLARVAALPEVVSAGFITIVPLDGTATSTVTVNVPGVESPPGRTGHEIDWAGVDGAYFEAVGIPVVAGRLFNEEDDMESPPVAIVSEAMATTYWPGSSAVGGTYTTRDGTEVRVVGVVADTKVRSLGEDLRPLVYGPASQMSYVHGRVIARTAADPAAVLPVMLEMATELDPDVITIDAKTMEQHLAFRLLPGRITAVTVSLMGGLALLLAATGLYGIVSFSVAARRRELGIRISVGAEPDRLVGMMLKAGLTLLAVGLAIGIAMAVFLTRIVRNLVHGVEAFDPLILVGAVLLMTGVATLAAYVPAKRASQVDPVSILNEG